MFIGKNLVFPWENKKFNITASASGLEKDTPVFFNMIIKSIKEYKKLVSNNKQKIDNINITKSKEFYEIFRKSHEISAKIENLFRNDNWELTYINQHKNLCSELRSHNFKVLFSALYTKDKFKKKNKQKKIIIRICAVCYAKKRRECLACILGM